MVVSGRVETGIETSEDVEMMILYVEVGKLVLMVMVVGEVMKVWILAFVSDEVLFFVFQAGDGLFGECFW